MSIKEITFSPETAEGYCPKLKSVHQITIVFSKQAPPESIWKWNRFECDYEKECDYVNNCPVFENAKSKIFS